MFCKLILEIEEKKKYERILFRRSTPPSHLKKGDNHLIYTSPLTPTHRSTKKPKSSQKFHSVKNFFTKNFFHKIFFIKFFFQKFFFSKFFLMTKNFFYKTFFNFFFLQKFLTFFFSKFFKKFFRNFLIFENKKRCLNNFEPVLLKEMYLLCDSIE